MLGHTESCQIGLFKVVLACDQVLNTQNEKFGNDTALDGVTWTILDL